MSERIDEMTVGELARIAGVTVRMLHHYDEIGLLHPCWIGPNGYRHYGRAEAERLQEILALRAGGVPLAEIGAVLGGAGDRVLRLEAHLARLRQEAGRLSRMIETLETTIGEEKKGRIMAIEDLYKPISAQKQTEYEEWLARTYGQEMAEAVEAARAAAERDPAAGTDESAQELKRIEGDLVAAYEAGVAPEAADLAPHRAWVGRMWGQPCTRAAHAGLADIYRAHPEFVARYETLAPGFSDWLTTAMKAADRDG
jgi:DNA-binding transcriptional MerR regulator